MPSRWTKSVAHVAVGLDAGEQHACRARPRPRAACRPARAVLDRVPVGGVASGTLSATVRTLSPWRRWWLPMSSSPLERAGEHQPDPALLEHVRDAVAAAGLEARIGGLGEAERAREEVGRLGGVAHVELEVVDAVNGHPVGAGLGGPGVELVELPPSAVNVRGVGCVFNRDSLRIRTSHIPPWTPLTVKSLRCCARTRDVRSRTSARKVGLSAPAVKRRVDRLERDGVIRGYTAVDRPARLRLARRGVRRPLLRGPHVRRTRSSAW